MAASVVSLFAARSAFAQVTSISVNTSQVIRQDSTGNLYECPGRGASGADGSSNVVGCVVEGSYQGIGFRDCSDNTKLVFSLTLVKVPDNTGHLETWAGTGDCTQAGATNNASTGICWKVAQDQSNLTNPFQETVWITDIVSQLGITPPSQVYSSQAPTTVCTTNAAASTTTTTTTDDSGVETATVGESTVNIFFMWFLNGQSTPTVNAAAYPVKVKLVGPAQCTGVTAGSGDGLLLVNWTPPDGDTTIQGFNLYSAPVGTTGSSDGGTITVCPDASPTGVEEFDDAGNPIVDDAGNPILFDDAGNPVHEDAGCYQQYVPPGTNSCTNGTGTIDISTANVTQINGTSNASGTIQGLTNGDSYDVAVAAFDQFGNAGTISNVVCASPAPIDDFWKVYNQDGGSAFCALEVVGKRGGGAAAALVSIAGIIFLRRRRRRDG
jgi:hypothetical protein